MSRSTPLSYAAISRPSYETAAIRRTAARASAAQQQQKQKPWLASAGDGTTKPVEGILGSSLSSLDTWSGFLYSQWEDTVNRQASMTSDGAPVGTPSDADLITSLHGVISRQNKVVSQLQERLMARRAQEEEEWELKKRGVGSTPDEGTSVPFKETTAFATVRPNEGAGGGAAENTHVCVLLSRILEHTRHLWADAVSQHFNSAEARKARTGNSTRASTKESADIKAEAVMEEERVGLPPIALLFRCLVDGINSEASQQAVVDAGLLPASAWEAAVLGVDQLGILTVFGNHVQALRAFPSIIPPLETLREYFAELHPQRLTTSPSCRVIDSALELAEAQIDAYLRVGDQTERVAALLREGLHPSVRRLVYARALQVPMAVTDGKPMFLSQGELTTNRLRHNLARYLTCSSRQAVAKVKRRFDHHYSSARQEDRARLLQRLALDDMFIHVGDSDNFFVYTDDVEMLATAVVVDRSLPDPKMSEALRQLGRPKGQLEYYITFLKDNENNLIHQKALPSGFAPVEGITFLESVLCNVTSDTGEQYELVAAMMAQVWGRLQGPTPELLQCCLLFESLVQRLALPAVVHATRDLQYPPLALAMRWIVTGFADFLDPFEVLTLWDLLLSYHMREMHRRSPLSLPVGLAHAAPHDTTTPCALWLLPMYAAAIFVARAPLVEACRTVAEVDAVFATGHQLRTHSLLQELLFSL